MYLFPGASLDFQRCRTIQWNLTPAHWTGPCACPNEPSGYGNIWVVNRNMVGASALQGEGYWISGMFHTSNYSILLHELQLCVCQWNRILKRFNEQISIVYTSNQLIIFNTDMKAESLASNFAVTVVCLCYVDHPFPPWSVSASDHWWIMEYCKC